MSHLARPFSKARSVNSSASAFTAPTVTDYKTLKALFTDAATAAARVVIPLSTQPGGSGSVPCAIDIFPYGLGSNNDTFSLRLIGWRRYPTPIADDRILMIPFLLCELGCTISAFVGAAGFPILNTERFADTLTIVSEPTYTADVTRTGGIELFSPANDTPAYARVPLRGAEAIEFDFDQTLNTPTMNALYSLISES